MFFSSLQCKLFWCFLSYCTALISESIKHTDSCLKQPLKLVSNDLITSGQPRFILQMWCSHTFLTASKWGFGPCLPLYLVLTTCDRISLNGRKWNVPVVCAQLSMHLLMYIRGRIKRSEWRRSPVDWTASCCRYSFLTISWLYCQFYNWIRTYLFINNLHLSPFFGHRKGQKSLRI